jgi:hypothetical protein
MIAPQRRLVVSNCTPNRLVTESLLLGLVDRALPAYRCGSDKNEPRRIIEEVVIRG